jgi:tetratricopeptide (TPR) repeat protein
MTREPLSICQRVRRQLTVGLVLIGAAAAVALGFRLSPSGQAWAHYQAGAEISCCGEPDPVAIQHFQTALRLNPRLFEARQGLAAIYVNLDKRREAAGLYEEALRRDPADPRPHYELAELALPENRAQAIHHLKTYLSLQPTDVHGWYLLAQCYGANKQRKETLDLWESIARRFPGDARAQRALPRVRAQAEQRAFPLIPNTVSSPGFGRTLAASAVGLKSVVLGIEGMT